MKNIEVLLNQIEFILDQLIANEERMNELSLVEPLHEEISKFQQKQEKLLSDLQNADIAFSESATPDQNSTLLEGKMRINQKLNHFQKLNDSFIERLKTGRHFIHFEVHRDKK